MGDSILIPVVVVLTGIYVATALIEGAWKIYKAIKARR